MSDAARNARRATESLRSLRARFDEALVHHGRLRCWLGHDEPDEGECIAVKHTEAGPAETPAWSTFCCYRDASFPTTPTLAPPGSKPYLDVHGTPIASRSGEPFAVIPPIERTVLVFGERRAWDVFTALATRAGEGISAIPLTDFAPVPAETFRTANPALRWIFLLFDGAWTQRWPALRAQRDCIHHQQIFPYDLQQLRKLKRHRVLGPQLSFPDRWLERLPHSFTSELDDLFSASSAAIDILTEQAGNPPNAESPVSGSSERHTAARPMDKEPEDGAPYLASRAFPKSLRSDTLAKAAEAGRVRRIRHGKHWRYSWPDAHKEWSHIVPVDPPKPKP